MKELSDEELEQVRRAFPTHFGEPAVSVLVQRMLTEIEESRAAMPTAQEREAIEAVREPCLSG